MVSVHSGSTPPPGEDGVGELGGATGGVGRARAGVEDHQVDVRVRQQARDGAVQRRPPGDHHLLGPQRRDRQRVHWVQRDGGAGLGHRRHRHQPPTPVPPRPPETTNVGRVRSTATAESAGAESTPAPARCTHGRPSARPSGRRHALRAAADLVVVVLR
ncbi:hypothetical protein BFG51_16225 [Dietzia alimentaria]|nr:hypothetical protein BFG51_16225 [Dietzia alimentaria]